MKNTIRGLVAAVTLVLVLAVAGEAQAQGNYAAELDAAISYYFVPADQPAARAIVACESGYGYDIYNDYSGAYGAWQFLPSTSYALGFDHAAMADPWYATWAASRYYRIAGWSPWACAY